MFLLQAADYCILEDGGVNWVYYDTDLRNYSYYCGELRDLKRHLKEMSAW